MSGLSETPAANRLRIAFFGRRNAGKSTLVNALAGQSVAIVSDVPGTTTDPVSKAMEILPLGPCLLIDTAGLDDDAGALGAERVRRTLDVLATADVAVWVAGPDAGPADDPLRQQLLDACRRRGVAVLDFRRGDSVEGLKDRLASLDLKDRAPGLLEGLVAPGDRVVCVCPIDASAPGGRLILPQVQVLRAVLDVHAVCAVCQPDELAAVLADGRADLVVTDSQAFGAVAETVLRAPRRPRLTSFSILFARQKGDLAAFARGVETVSRLRDGDTVLVAEGCTHRRQCGDIGTEKIPKALARLSGRRLNVVFASGADFAPPPGTVLVVQCGGCMLTRREMGRRLEIAAARGIPVVNYGLLLAAAKGIRLASDDGSPLVALEEGTHEKP